MGLEPVFQSYMNNSFSSFLRTKVNTIQATDRGIFNKWIGIVPKYTFQKRNPTSTLKIQSMFIIGGSHEIQIQVAKTKSNFT